jgi:hypothetical protein
MSPVKTPAASPIRRSASVARADSLRFFFFRRATFRIGGFVVWPMKESAA